MVFEKDIICILEKYEGKVITKELISVVISEYEKMFICPSWVDDIEKCYNTDTKDNDPGDKKL